MAALPGVLPDPQCGLDSTGMQPLPSDFDFVSTAVPLSSTVGRQLCAKVRESVPDAVFDSITRIGNRMLWMAFQACKKTITRDGERPAHSRLLFHGTQHVSDIIGNGLGGNASGFDNRMSKPGAYGSGAYFAAHAAYPLQIHPRHQNDDGTFTLIIAEVLLGSVKDYGDVVNDETRKLRRPPAKSEGHLYDSIRGTEASIGLRHRTNRLSLGEQYVVFDKGQAYPHFLVRVRAPSVTWSPQTYLQNILRPGRRVAFFSPAFKRCLAMKPETDKWHGDSTKFEDAMPLDPTTKPWEVFDVVDAGQGTLAFYNQNHRRFLRMSDSKSIDASPRKDMDATKLPADWMRERWKVVVDDRCKITLLNCCTKLYLCLDGEGEVHGRGKTVHEVVDEKCLWERFIVVPEHGEWRGRGGDWPPSEHLQAMLKPGSRITLYSPAYKGYMHMRDRGSDWRAGSLKHDPIPLDPTSRRWEVFDVVDAGKGTLALYSQCHHRFLQMCDDMSVATSGTEVAPTELSAHSLRERWVPNLNEDGTQITLLNVATKTYLCLDGNGDVHGRGATAKSGISFAFKGEYFRVVPPKPPLVD